MKNIMKKAVLILAVLIIGMFLICCKGKNKENNNYSPETMDNGFEPLEIVDEYNVELGEGDEGLEGAHD